MNDRTRGRGAFIFITIITALFLINGVYTYFFVDTEAVYKTGIKEKGPCEFGAWVGISLNLVFLFWNAILIKGVRRTVGAFIITVFIAWLAEGLGVHYGYVFGHYHYTELLGYQIWAVPIIVCLAWEPILYAAYCLTDFIVPSEITQAHSFLHRLLSYLMMAVIGGIATTAWDLMIDPFAVNRGWWVWEQGGPYVPYIENGVPISNFFGWWKVAFVCHLVYRSILETGRKPRRSLYLNVYGPMMLYLNLFIGGFSSAMIFLKRPDVAMVGVMCMGGLFLIAFSKVFLLKRGVEPAPGDGWLMESAREQ